MLVNGGKSCDCLTGVYTLMLSCPFRSVRFHTVLHWNGGCQLAKHHPRGILRWVQSMFGMCRPCIYMPSVNWEHLCQLSMPCILITGLARGFVRIRCCFSKCMTQYLITQKPYYFFALLEGMVCEVNPQISHCFITHTFYNTRSEQFLLNSSEWI